MSRTTRSAVVIFLLVLALLLALSAYGYMSGSWETPPQ